MLQCFFSFHFKSFFHFTWSMNKQKKIGMDDDRFSVKTHSKHTSSGTQLQSKGRDALQITPVLQLKTKYSFDHWNISCEELLVNKYLTLIPQHVVPNIHTLVSFTLKAASPHFPPQPVQAQLVSFPSVSALTENTTAACTHKGGSSGHTWRAAHRTNTEVTSWEHQESATPRRSGWTSLPLFPLHSDDIGSYVRMWTRPLTPRALTPPPKLLIAHSAQGGRVPFALTSM